MHRCRSGSRRARGRLDEGEPAARRRPVGAGRRLRDGGRRRSIRPVLAGDGRQGCVVADAVSVIKVSSDEAPSKELPEREDSAASKGREVVGEAQEYTGYGTALAGPRAPGGIAPGSRGWSTGSSASRCRTPSRSSTATVLGSRVSRKPAIWLLRRARRWDKPRWHNHRQGHGRSRLGVRKQGHRDQDPVHKVLQQGLPEREAAALIVRRSISLSGGQ
jgi:hypothetical protein